MNILGIWDGHDSGAALLVDGRLVSAVNEERLTRRKLEIRFPLASIRTCLEIAGLRPSDIDLVATTTTDVAKTIARIVPSSKEAYYQVRRRKRRAGVSSRLARVAKYLITEWKPNALSRAASAHAIRRALGPAGLGEARLRMYDHHECHAAAAAYSSGFDSCVVLTIDGVGDGKSATVSWFVNGRLEHLASTPARHSPGVFFEHVTHLLNMRELEDEGKVMALADYAAPVDDRDNEMLQLLTSEGLTFRTAIAGHRLERRLRAIHWRYPNEQLAQMAQRALEEACVPLAARALRQTGERRIALAGGVASNVKMNRRIRLLDGLDDVFVFPHMGDGGLPVGAAALAQVESGAPLSLQLDDIGLGSEYTPDEMKSALEMSGLEYVRCQDLTAAVVRLLAQDGIVLWFQGRMEYGPRSLGHRSVLARPDRPNLRDRLNLVLKRRVWYQPFCPSVLEHDARVLLSDFTGSPNRHMTMAYQVAEEHRDKLCGVVNVDGSCRPQIIADDTSGPFADLLRSMKRRVGVGAVLNTSFNRHGSPIVCTPAEAIEVFKQTPADALVLGPFLVQRATCGADDLREGVDVVSDPAVAR